MKTKSNSTPLFGWFFIGLISIIPLVLWINIPLQISIFSLLGFGKILGLTGTTLFSISFVLSTRLKILEKLFNGFNKIYDSHSKIGQLGLILLLLHPLFLIQNYSTSPNDAIKFLLPSDNFPINLGIFSLSSMLFLIIITLYLRPKYNLWKFTHKFLGLSFFIAALHVYLIPSDTSQDLLLRIYMLGILLIGLASFTYKTLLGKYLIKKFKYKVIRVDKLNNQITEIEMVPVYDRINYNPGQFAFLSFDNNQTSKESHPFSFTSNPNENNILILVKNLGDYTSKIVQIPIDSAVTVEGPYGNFNFLSSKNKNQIWIAGGIGVTPFISMAKSLTREGFHKVDLYYCVRRGIDGVKYNDLKLLSENLQENFRVFIYTTFDNGRITPNYINQNSGGFDNKDIYICAPVPMIISLKKAFIKSGVHNNNIYSEEFDF